MVTIDDVLVAVAAQIVDLEPTIGTHDVPVAVRKLPIHLKTIDPVEQIIVCPAAAPGGETPYTFRKREYTHLVDVVLVAPNYNNQVSYLDELSLIAQRLLQHFARPLSWAISTRHVRSKPKELFSRRAIQELKLDVLAVEVSVTSIARVVS